MGTPVTRLAEAADPQAGWSLPSWTYSDPEYFEIEMARLMRPSWQIVCHANDLAKPGEWRTLAFLGESIIVVRGKDGEVRAFTNVCRHRGSRILDGDAGCTSRFVCPYHGWTYDLEGRLCGVGCGFVVGKRADFAGIQLGGTHSEGGRIRKGGGKRSERVRSTFPFRPGTLSYGPGRRE